MSGRRASVVFGTRSVDACVWFGNEHGREEISGGRYRMGWSKCTGASLPRKGGSCGSCGRSLSTSSEILDAGEDTKLKVGEEARLVSGDDSDETESPEPKLKSETRDRRLRTSGDSMWVMLVGYGGSINARVFVGTVEGKTSL
jgi:hypothetical protein